MNNTFTMRRSPIRQNLIRITGFPFFMVRKFPFGNSYHAGSNKAMFSAKSINACNRVLIAIRVSDNESFHFRCLLIWVLFAKPVSITDFSTGFRTVFKASSRLKHFFNTFRGLLFPKVSLPNLLSCFRRDFSSQARSSDGIDINRRIECVNPILFSLDQEWHKNQFDNFKKKCVMPILIKSTLQNDVVMSFIAKFTEMVSPSIAQICGTSNVKLACSQASDFVDTAGRGNVKGLLNRVQCGHSYTPPQLACSLGIDRVSSTVYADQLDLYYTTTIPHSPASHLALVEVSYGC